MVAAGNGIANGNGNGNNAQGIDACLSSPAGISLAVAVGASDSNDHIASFSNTGPCVDIFAPGEGVYSDDASDPTAWLSMDGTSTAAPHVAGAIGECGGERRRRSSWHHEGCIWLGVPAPLCPLP